jgi:hypothetical protein
MKRKAAHKPKTARAKKPDVRKRGGPATAKPADATGALVAASGQALGLPLDPAWLEAVAFNLRLILRHAALVDEFPLPDEAEPAPVFRA